MKKTAQHKKIWHDAVLLWVTLLSMAALAVAWFVTTHQADTSGMSMATVEVLEGAMSLDGSTDLKDGKAVEIKLPENLALTAISGDGITFYRPETDPYTGEAKEGTWQKLTDAAANKDYLTFDLYAHANQPSALYLDGTSTLSAMTRGGDAKQTAVENMLSDANGTFTSAFYTGAARVAFLNVPTTGKPTLLTVWVPNSTYKLSQESGVWSFETDGEPEEAYRYYNGTQLTELGQGNYFTENPTRQKIVALQMADSNEAYPYTAHVRVVVWIEGTDREATAPQISGGIDLNLAMRLAPQD